MAEKCATASAAESNQFAPTFNNRTKSLTVLQTVVSVYGAACYIPNNVVKCTMGNVGNYLSNTKWLLHGYTNNSRFPHIALFRLPVKICFVAYPDFSLDSKTHDMQFLQIRSTPHLEVVCNAITSGFLQISPAAHIGFQIVFFT